MWPVLDQVGAFPFVIVTRQIDGLSVNSLQGEQKGEPLGSMWEPPHGRSLPLPAK